MVRFDDAVSDGLDTGQSSHMMRPSRRAASKHIQDKLRKVERTDVQEYLGEISYLVF